MTDDMPKDPFLNNPLFAIDNEALRALEEGVEYFEFFGEVFYGHVHQYSRLYVEALLEEEVLDNDTVLIEPDDLGTLVVHGIMIGILSQQDEDFIEQLRNNI